MGFRILNSILQLLFTLISIPEYNKTLTKVIMKYWLSLLLLQIPAPNDLIPYILEMDLCALFNSNSSES